MAAGEQIDAAIKVPSPLPFNVILLKKGAEAID